MEKIISAIEEEFDVYGIVEREGRRLIVLGLERTPQRDIDLWQYGEKGWDFTGFRLYFYPPVERVMGLIREAGYQARRLSQQECNFKHLAVQAGIGLQGKNTLVITPHFGARLRLLVVETDLLLHKTGQDAYVRQPAEYCRDCEACIKNCPRGVLIPYRLRELDNCASYIDLHSLKSVGPEGIAICNQCADICPI